MRGKKCLTPKTSNAKANFILIDFANKDWNWCKIVENGLLVGVLGVNEGNVSHCADKLIG